MLDNQPGQMLDITGSEFVQIQIRNDGKVIWVHTLEGMTVLRVCQIERLEIRDDRSTGED